MRSHWAGHDNLDGETRDPSTNRPVWKIYSEMRLVQSIFRPAEESHTVRSTEVRSNRVAEHQDGLDRTNVLSVDH